MTGKPTVLTAELADTICERLADKESLRTICQDPDMPCKATVFRWLHADAGFKDRYERAREAQADSHVDDIIDIADDPALDANEKRIRIDARKWVAGKQRPKKYGDKIAHVGGGPDDTPIQYANLSEEEIDARLAALAIGTGASQDTAD